VLKRALERFQQKPIKRTLIQINLVTTGIALLLASVILITDEMVSFRRSLIDNLTIQAKIIGNSSVDNLLFNATIEAEVDLASLEKSKSVAVAVIYARDGKVFATYHRDGARNNFIPPAPQGDGYESGINRLSVYRQIFLEDARLGTIYIEADFNEFYIRLARYLFLEVIVIALSLYLAFFLLSTLHQAITNPLRELVELMRGVSKDRNYTVRLAIPSRNELGALAESFNDMLSQIQERDAELKMHRERLEAEVAKRTEELERELAERERAEERLQGYAREMKENNEELQAFVYSAAHDLRSPLVNIKGFATELTNDLYQNLMQLDSGLHKIEDEESRTKVAQTLHREIPAALGFINASVDRMNALINAMLRLSRLNQRSLKCETIDMTAVVNAIVESRTLEIERKKISVLVGALPAVAADKTSMKEIMAGLLDNALKYREPGRAGTVEVSGEQTSSETVYHVRDNGRGIDKNDIQKVFEMFRRAGRQDVPGEGMGLAYVKALVRRHGGRIWCESEPGVGTTFSFTLHPLCAGAQGASPMTGAAPAMFRSGEKDW
jgi:signal transduction histidine kinase